MKPVPIANFLDQIGRSPGEKSPCRENSPFRPRSLQTTPFAEPRPAVAPQAKFAVPPMAPSEELAHRPLFEPRPFADGPSVREAVVAREAGKAEEIALRVAEAHARGRAEGLAEARAEAEERSTAERAEAREQAVLERVEFQLNEYAQLETSIRSGLMKVEENVGEAVARILAPFLTEQAVKRIVEELGKAIRRLCAGGPPGLVTIRGPERILRLLCERIADLPAQIDYVEDGGVEAVVEAGVTHIVTQLQPWAELLASLDA